MSGCRENSQEYGALLKCHCSAPISALLYRPQWLNGQWSPLGFETCTRHASRGSPGEAKWPVEPVRGVQVTHLSKLIENEFGTENESFEGMREEFLVCFE
jgi:hypothetical protein